MPLSRFFVTLLPLVITILQWLYCCIAHSPAMMVPRNREQQIEIINRLLTFFKLFRNLRNI